MAHKTRPYSAAVEPPKAGPTAPLLNPIPSMNRPGGRTPATQRRRSAIIKETQALYSIELTQRAKDGADIARIVLEGRTFEAVSSHGVTMALAREVTAAGYGDGPWEAVGRDGKRRLFGPSLHRLARLTIWENDRDGIRLHLFKARPNGLEQKAAADRLEPALSA